MSIYVIGIANAVIIAACYLCVHVSWVCGAIILVVRLPVATEPGYVVMISMRVANI